MTRNRLLFPLILLLTAACARSPGQATPTLPATTNDVAATATVPQPTAVPTATARPPLVVLLAPDGSDEELLDELEALVAREAAARGLRWQLRQEMSVQEISDEAAYVVAAPSVEGLADLVQGAPDTMFLAVGLPAVETAENLVQVSVHPEVESFSAFLGGYTAALITPEARIGMITVQDGLESSRFERFVNGMRYYCGLCRPQYAPFYEYPFLLSLPAGASAAEWRSLADFMRDRFVGTVYVTPGAGGGALYRALGELGVRIIGGEQPAEEMKDFWVASIRVDLLSVYMEQVPALLDGAQGTTIVLSPELREVNSALLSPGRQRLVEEVLEDLRQGFILPGAPVAP